MCGAPGPDGKAPAVLITSRQFMSLIERAQNCIDNKPKLYCGQKYIDQALSLESLNYHEASIALNLNALLAQRNGDLEEAVWSYSRILELPERFVTTGLAMRAAQQLETLAVAD